MMMIIGKYLHIMIDKKKVIFNSKHIFIYGLIQNKSILKTN